MTTSITAATRTAIARGPAPCVERGMAFLWGNTDPGALCTRRRSVAGAAQIEQRVDPSVLPRNRVLGTRIGDPTRAVDDERIPMLASAKRESHRPAPRTFVARERRGIGIPFVEVSRHGDSPRIGSFEHQAHEPQ